jgi:hypothetical protein
MVAQWFEDCVYRRVHAGLPEVWTEKGKTAMLYTARLSGPLPAGQLPLPPTSIEPVRVPVLTSQKKLPIVGVLFQVTGRLCRQLVPKRSLGYDLSLSNRCSHESGITGETTTQK